MREQQLLHFTACHGLAGMCRAHLARLEVRGWGAAGRPRGGRMRQSTTRSRQRWCGSRRAELTVLREGNGCATKTRRLRQGRWRQTERVLLGPGGQGDGALHNLPSRCADKIAFPVLTLQFCRSFRCGPTYGAALGRPAHCGAHGCTRKRGQARGECIRTSGCDVAFRSVVLVSD
jgi:hypothetical protein